jgi:hypothetical protein
MLDVLDQASHPLLVRSQRDHGIHARGAAGGDVGGGHGNDEPEDDGRGKGYRRRRVTPYAIIPLTGALAQDKRVFSHNERRPRLKALGRLRNLPSGRSSRGGDSNPQRTDYDSTLDHDL